MAADLHIVLDGGDNINIDGGEEGSANKKIGNLGALTTDDKSDLVSAINEVDAHADNNASKISDVKNDIGNKASLTTDAKTNLVAAINELDAEIGGDGGDSLQDQITNLKNIIESFGFSVVDGALNVTYMEES